MATYDSRMEVYLGPMNGEGPGGLSPNVRRDEDRADQVLER
jgi:hypothetical protein